MDITLGERRITVRPPTLGDLPDFGPAVAALDAFLTAEPNAQPALLPGLTRALAPCLCRLTGLTTPEFDALTLPEFLALLAAVGEALQPPFPLRQG